MKTDSSAIPCIAEQYLKRLNSFLQHHSYIVGYTLSRTDLNLHKALIRQYPQYCITIEALSKSQATDGFFHSSPLSSVPDTLPHVKRWAMHVASFTEAEEASLPRSYQMVEDFLRSLMEEVKARTKIIAEIILFCGLSVLFSFLLCESHCRPNNFDTF